MASSACGKKAPPSAVARPFEWSGCRCVISSVSISPGAMPVAARLRSNWPDVFCICVPAPVSISAVRPPDWMMKQLSEVRRGTGRNTARSISELSSTLMFCSTAMDPSRKPSLTTVRQMSPTRRWWMAGTCWVGGSVMDRCAPRFLGAEESMLPAARQTPGRGAGTFSNDHRAL